MYNCEIDNNNATLLTAPKIALNIKIMVSHNLEFGLLSARYKRISTVVVPKLVRTTKLNKYIYI